MAGRRESTQTLPGVSRIETGVYSGVDSSRHFAIYQQKQTSKENITDKKKISRDLILEANLGN